MLRCEQNEELHDIDWSHYNEPAVVWTRVDIYTNTRAHKRTDMFCEASQHIQIPLDLQF